MPKHFDGDLAIEIGILGNMSYSQTTLLSRAANDNAGPTPPRSFLMALLAAASVVFRGDDVRGADALAGHRGSGRVLVHGHLR